MSTDYRRGIPSREHIEAATRLGLEWPRLEGRIWRFEIRNGEIFGDSDPHTRYFPYLLLTENFQDSQLRPIRPDGTPVDWKVLDGTVSPAQPQAAPQLAQPEPRRFADVRPNRHGWRWWRAFGDGCSSVGSTIEVDEATNRWRRGSTWYDWVDQLWLDHTVIPTDEQGNPVSWDSIGPNDPYEIRLRRGQPQTVTATVAPGVSVQAGTLMMQTPEGVRPAATLGVGVPLAFSSISFSTILDSAQRHGQLMQEGPQLWREALRQAASSTRTVVEIYRDLRREARLNGQPSTKAFTTNPRSENPGESTPLPRFTADELDDVDHSQSTTLDSAPLKRGKLPTPEQIGKYREVMARRSGTVAEALKSSGIDCEVAQYVLDRWAGGLGDKEALWTIIVAEGTGTLAPSIDRATIDERVQRARKPALDTSEPADGTAQRQREEREAQRQRMAALQAQLAAERAALRSEPQPEPTRFDLLECDLEANPAASCNTPRYDLFKGDGKHAKAN